MSKAWWHTATVYQVYPRSFNDSNGDGIGDIPGIIKKLDYLALLGIDVIWLSPVYQSPNDDNGYDISDYYSIMDDFGTMEDMESLIAAANKKNIKIIMDLVINHTSDEHPWFVESKKSKNNEYRDYYIWRDGNGGPPSNITSVFGGSAWEFDSITDQYYFHLFSKKQPDLNLHNNKVRESLYKMMTFWLEKGISGFRMDVIDLIGKEIDNGIVANGPKLHEYLHEMHERVLSKYPVMTVGETPSATTDIAKLYTGPGRDELDMVFTFEHMSLDEVQGKGKWELKDLELLDLKRVLMKWQKDLHNNGWNSLYWNNHDQPRIVSRWGNDKQYRVESAKMLATVLHMMQGTPYIYQGEEIGMTNIAFDSIDDYKDIETINLYKERMNAGIPHEKIMKSIYAKGRDNARTPMQWNDSPNGGFTTGDPWISVNPNYSKVNARQALEDENSIFHYYRKLISLRKNNETIVYGNFELLVEEHPEIFAYTRSFDNETLLIVANFYDGKHTFSLPNDIQYNKANVLISNYNTCSSNPTSIELRPYEAIVYSLS
ncbi:glycoside hydrolase family 13 protein [Bacillus sp. REN16]|uniref:glycoside hydrolase family 13 protein n=1 Tax=Bacillus sp. REN16 TaxID=2887296 RepID=UPI001E35EE83|nr:alpha-glucosidase [Bacillus sp. REN16]MCC3358489.1 alpha-glucosidase [Bacillus sp. REN16]